jgi:hypothetical protein
MRDLTFRLADDLFAHIAHARSPDQPTTLAFAASREDVPLGSAGVRLPADYVLRVAADSEADAHGEEVAPNADGFCYDLSVGNAYELVHAPTGAVLVRMRVFCEVATPRAVQPRRRRTRQDDMVVSARL